MKTKERGNNTSDKHLIYFYKLCCFSCVIIFNPVLAQQAETTMDSDKARTQEHMEEQQTPQPESLQNDNAEHTAVTNKASKSGYQEMQEFGGPSSVTGVLKEDDTVKQTLFRFDGMRQVFKPYFDFKAKLKSDFGLSLGADYTALYQWANQSLGADDAAGGIFRFYGDWTWFGRESGNTGSFVFKVENRHRIGTQISPKDLGFEMGYAGFTAPIYADYSWGVTNLFWRQRFLEGRVSLVAGILDVTDYLDVYGMVNPWTSFNNLAFLTSATIPAPNQGLGVGIGAMLTDNIYLIAGFADTNGDPANFTDNFDTFFNDGEYFTHIEIGWTSAQDSIYLDNVHITAWHADKREQALTPEGWGISFSAATYLDEKWMPFLRGGYAKDGGALWEGTVSLGLGYRTTQSDLLGVGLNWSRPSESSFSPGLSDQYTMEVFYRFQLTENFALTPDIQLIIDPALNPEVNSIWVLGMRARLSL